GALVRVILTQAVLIVCWLFLFADHRWGRQSFGLIAVASSVYLAAALALLARLIDVGATKGTHPLEQELEKAFEAAQRLLRSAGTRAAFAASSLALVLAGAAILYVAAEKIGSMFARVEATGMISDSMLALNEAGYELRDGNDLLPLSEAKNVGQWLLWSR